MMTQDRKTPFISGRMAVSLVYDVCAAITVMQFTIWLRYNFEEGEYGLFYLWQASLIYGAVALCVYLWIGLHRGIWRFTSFDALVQILKAVTISTILFVPVLFLFTRLEDFPRIVPFLHWPLLVGVLSAPRIAYRLFRSGDLAAAFEHEDPNRIPILLLGPSNKMEPFIREAQRLGTEGFPYRLVGLIDPEPAETGHDVRGKRIVGDLRTIESAVERLRDTGRAPQKLVLVDPDIKGEVVAGLLETCDRLGIGLARAPAVTDLQSSDSSKPVDIRPVDLRDLLGRPQKVLDRAAMKQLIAGKRVLITGAGGTIGSELTRQAALLGPAKIIVLDNSEFNLYQIDLELSESHNDLPREQILADVRDRHQIDLIFAHHKPEIVLHAAALKHVPIVEDNPVEGMLTNVAGTRNVVDAGLTHGVGTMVMISTDKAVNPSNVMGASKRIAELYCQAQDLAQSKTNFVTVRFGNVLGSTGSVVPLFQRQLENGGPLTVTHPDITRYFMTTREAVELVLQAAALDQAQKTLDGTTDGRIFVLDMGKPIHIRELAERMIKLAGLEPGQDIEITYTGLRPGEKLHESLFHEQEKHVQTKADGILLAAPRVIDLGQLRPALDRLIESAISRETQAVYRVMRTLVPEFEGRDPADHEEPQRNDDGASGDIRNLH